MILIPPEYMFRRPNPSQWYVSACAFEDAVIVFSTEFSEFSGTIEELGLTVRATKPRNMRPWECVKDSWARNEGSASKIRHGDEP